MNHPIPFFKKRTLLSVGAALSLTLPSALAMSPQFVISINDQTSFYAKEAMFVRPMPRPGCISILDISANPTRIWHAENVPCSVVGPPSEAAISKDGREILVASAMRADPRKPGQLSQDSRITRLRLTERGLERLGEIDAGIQPSGIRISNNGGQAWVALRGEGAIALISLSAEGMKIEKKWAVASPEDSIADIAISPDETTAFATLHEAHTMLVFDVNTKGELSLRQRIKMPMRPYHIAFFPDGQRILVSCTIGADVISLLEKSATGEWAIRDNVPAGRIPEGVFISPDGRWVAATCFDGANICNPQNPWFGRPARLYIYSVQEDGSLRQTQALKLDGVPQGAAFSSDSKQIFATQFGPGNLAVFSFDGKEWVSTGDVLELPGQPAALISARN